MLPKQHVHYFGIQAQTKGSNSNAAEIHNFVSMMLGHEIFDPEIEERVLIDHAFIVAGGETYRSSTSSRSACLQNEQKLGYRYAGY